MPVQIDRIESTVDVDTDGRSQGTRGETSSQWDAITRARREREREERDRARTSAWDHDD
jgi:hypothetical protein